MALLTGTPYNTVDAYAGYNLGDTNSFYLGPSVVVFATGNGVTATGGGQNVTIQGTLIGQAGIVMGDNTADISANIHVMSGGAVSGYVGAGIDHIGSDSFIQNDGTVTGQYGIRTFGDGIGVTEITNTGLIQSALFGVFHNGSNKVSLINSGKIFSVDFEYSFISSGGAAIDTVINRGLMYGAVALGGGDDSFDGRGGKVVGGVFGGDGADKIIGSSFSERLDGGAGSDTLTGGLGKDIISGGGIESDKFQFNSSSEVGDTITDFTTADFLLFKSSAFGNLPKGTLASSAFHRNDTGLAHDSSDRFIYDLDSDKLHYDSNGNLAGGTKIIITDFSYDVDLTRADIQIV